MFNSYRLLGGRPLSKIRAKRLRRFALQPHTGGSLMNAQYQDVSFLCTALPADSPASQLKPLGD